MRIAIIGAGASGMMAAAALAELGVPGSAVTVFDGNSKMGKKVAITGGGRCNVTTGISSKKDLLSKYPRGAEFLERSLGAFSPKKAREWFESHGCPIKIQDDLRAFPVSDKGGDVVAAFERVLSKTRSDLRLGHRVVSVGRSGGGFEIVSVPVPGDSTSSVAGKTELFDTVIIATGGAAYSNTGSAGGGYAFACGLGHSVTALAPSLSAFIVSETWCADLSGLSVPSAKFVDREGKTVSEGAVMFTHFGVTGPAVFALSARLAFENVSPENVRSVNLVPDASKRFEDWDRDLSAALAKDGAKETKNVLAAFFPRRFAEILPTLAGLHPEKKAATVSRDERKLLAKLLSDGISLTLCGTRPGEEFVTAGGVELLEIDAETMESKIVPNLYFTGEVLNVDAVTGGFNLQACWSTGYAAAKAVSKRFSASDEAFLR